MEKRGSKRIPVVIDVLLYHNNIPVVSCKTHDIGADGLFVDSGPLSYTPDTELKVEFQFSSESGPACYLLPALVVRRSNNGLGLLLPGGESEAMRAWRDKVMESVLKKSVEVMGTILTGNKDPDKDSNTLDAPKKSRRILN